MAMFPDYPPANVEAALGRLHTVGVGASGTGFNVVHFIIADGKAASKALHLILITC